MIIFNTNKIKEDRFFYSELFSMQEIKKELLRPWKLVFLVIGMIGLISGAMIFKYPDWDIGVSIIMGLLTYFTAAWSVSTFMNAIVKKDSNWKFKILLSVVVGLLVVDGSYMAWHTLVGNETLRGANFLVSSFLYVLAGFVWLYRGSAKDMINDIKSIEVENTEISKKI